ncbi:MAG: Proline--tRNA ligase [Ignavibacteriaceae bacterium]|nr:Proline--tRNA ligase [Ignavibacteriaceae bacterium]
MYEIDKNILNVKEWVNKNQLVCEFIYHERSGKSTSDAVNALGIDRDMILKTLILYAKKEKIYIGTIIPGNERLNMDKVKTLTLVKNLRFAKNVEIERVTGFSIGGIPPFSVLQCTYSFIDSNVIKKNFVVGAGGSEYCGIKFNPLEFQKIIKISVADLV